jgi:hypothetical protein
MEKAHGVLKMERKPGNRGSAFTLLAIVLCFSSLVALTGCSNGDGHSKTVVNSLEDIEGPALGTVTLRSALEDVASGGKITFEESLDGGTIELTIVGNEHSVLVGEWMEMYYDPGAGVMITELLGYFDRDFGKSALYAHKDVEIDASNLPSGITVTWANTNVDARVLAVYGDLTMSNVTITGGRSVAEVMDGDNPTTQTATLARGGGLAVWGLARLNNCTLHDNQCDKSNDTASERDQGAFGGGIYADVVDLKDCVISGNAVYGSGVSGGGVFVIGGAEHTASVSTIDRCAVTGNLLEAGSAYGAGVYCDGGGIGESKTLRLSNCTVARNVVDGIESSRGYWRGGAIYMSNGYMELQACTIVENHVSGYWREDLLGKCSLAGGVAATIGLAHAVESMTIGHSIIAGNTVTDKTADSEKGTYDQDIFTGSLLYFKSRGYNRIGAIDFSQILVPVGEHYWWSLSRRHYPKDGDEHVADLSEVLDLDNGTYSTVARSMGVDAGDFALLYYEPAGSAVDQIPLSYTVDEIEAEYEVEGGDENDNFLEIFLDRIEDYFNIPGFASTFTTDFENFLATHDADTGDSEDPEPDPYYDSYDPLGDPILTVADTAFFGPNATWVKEPENYPLILFWHQFDVAIAEAVPTLGDELIGDAQWDDLFDDETLEENSSIDFSIRSLSRSSSLLDLDQIETPRPENDLGDIGAIEKQ